MKKIQLDKRNIKGNVERQELLYHLTRYYFASGFIKKGDYVLDAASGVGYGTYLLSQSSLHTSLVGIDIDKKTVEYAKNKFQNYNVLFQHSSLEQFQTKKLFDIIISFETVEHVNDATEFVRKCHQVLKPGGVLIISSPNKQVMSPHTDKPLTQFHVKEFTQMEFLSLLEKYFTEIQLYGQYHDFPHSVLAFRERSAGILKLLSNDSITRSYLDLFRMVNRIFFKNISVRIDKKLLILFTKHLTHLKMYPKKITSKTPTRASLFMLAVCQKKTL